MFENVDDRLCRRIFLARILKGDVGDECVVEADTDLDTGEIGDCKGSTFGNGIVIDEGDFILADRSLNVDARGSALRGDRGVGEGGDVSGGRDNGLGGGRMDKAALLTLFSGMDKGDGL